MKYEIISESNIKVNEKEKNRYTQILKNKNIKVNINKKIISLSYNSFLNICLMSYSYPEEQILFTYNPEYYEEKEFDLEDEDTQHLLIRSSILSNESITEKKENKIIHYLFLTVMFLNLILFAFAFFYIIHLIKIYSGLLIINSNFYYILNISIVIGLILNGLAGIREFVFNLIYDIHVHKLFSILNIILSSIILFLIYQNLYIGKDLYDYITNGKTIYILNICVIITEISSLFINFGIEVSNK